MMQKQSYQPLVQGDDACIGAIQSSKKFVRILPCSQITPGMSVLLILLAVSFVSNLMQAWYAIGKTEIHKLSKYSKLELDSNATWISDLGEETQAHWEDRLEAISIDEGIIAVSKEWAEENDLGETSIFPWDENKRVYAIHAYHGLHCIRLIYRFVKEIRDDDKQATRVPIDHVIHCLDAMRKDVMCYADDTPRPRRYRANSTAAIKVAGEPRQCRDWSALERWAKERTACFQPGNAVPGDMLRSQMRFCPDNSPYMPAVRAYFGKGDDWYPKHLEGP